MLKVVLHDTLSRESAGLYPVNSLRNIALHDVTSEFTLGCVLEGAGVISVESYL